MMSLTFGLFTQVSGSGPLDPLVLKKLLVQFRSFAIERYCLQLKMIVSFRRHASFIIKALCLVDSSDIYK